MHGAYQIDGERWWIPHTNTRSITDAVLTPVPRPSGTVMFEELIASRVGQVIHRVIAAAVRDGLSEDETEDLLNRLWLEKPIGGTTAWQTRTRAHLAVSVYLRRLRPQGWELLAAEMHLGTSVADLVWCRPNRLLPTVVFIDEVKTGRRPLDAPELADQIHRLAADGDRIWGAAFGGVRVAQTMVSSQSRFWHSDGTSLSPADGPALASKAGTV